MANGSPFKFPKFNNPELEAVKQEAQLVCFYCTDGGSSREDIKAKCVEGFEKVLSILKKKERQQQAYEQQVKLLRLQLGKAELERAAAVEQLEVLQSTYAFCSDEKEDAVTQTDHCKEEQEQEQE